MLFLSTDLPWLRETLILLSQTKIDFKQNFITKHCSQVNLILLPKLCRIKDKGDRQSRGVSPILS